MSSQRIWLLRHGESEWNAVGRWQGHGDPPLSRDGRAAADGAAAAIASRVLASGRPVRIFSSDLARAVQTAAAVATAVGVPPSPVPALRELDLGTWSGLTRAEIATRDPERLAAFDTGGVEVRAGGGETRAELRARVQPAVAQLAHANPEADLLLVVHLGVVRVLVPGADPRNLELVEARREDFRPAR